MKTFITTTAMLMLLTSAASACPDYIMSCTAAGREAMGYPSARPSPPQQTKTTCITVVSNGKNVTRCTTK